MKISTIIPAFNSERTIADTIDSALAQQCDGHEIVVVDDGSTDSTPTILNGYADRIQVVTHRNRGAAAARNAGVAQSTGDYLAFLDSDDIWAPGKLTNMIAALERNPAGSLAFSEFGFIDKNGIEYRSSFIGQLPSLTELMSERPFPLFSFEVAILTSTWVIPRIIFERTGGFVEAFKGVEGYEDCWMLLLLGDLGEFVYVPDKLTFYRVAYPVECADKYGGGLQTFVRLVKKRYGSRGNGLIRAAKNQQCRWLLVKIAHQMDRGDRAGVLSSLAQIARLQPAYFLSREFNSRLRLPQNTKRIRELMMARARS